MDRKHKAENKISESSFLSVKVRSFFIENESSNVRKRPERLLTTLKVLSIRILSITSAVCEYLSL